MLTKGSEVHPGTIWVFRLPDKQWPLATCSFCGGISTAELIKLLEADAECAGSEWKNDFPHKFYLWADGGTWKYYSEHLTDVPASEFEQASKLIAKHLHISFSYDEVGVLRFLAPMKDYKKERFSE